MTSRYSLRLPDAVAAMILLSAFWIVGTLMLVSQEKKGYQRAFHFHLFVVFGNEK